MPSHQGFASATTTLLAKVRPLRVHSSHLRVTEAVLLLIFLSHEQSPHQRCRPSGLLHAKPVGRCREQAAGRSVSQGDSSKQGPSNSISRVERLAHTQLEAESQGSWQRSSSLTGTCSPGRDGSSSALLTGLCQTDTLVSADGSTAVSGSALSLRPSRVPRGRPSPQRAPSAPSTQNKPI